VECNIYRNNQSHYVRCPALRLLCNSLCGPQKMFGRLCGQLFWGRVRL